MVHRKEPHLESLAYDMVEFDMYQLNVGEAVEIQRRFSTDAGTDWKCLLDAAMVVGL